jgi:hypothetical protein
MEFNNLEQELNKVNEELAKEIRNLSPVDTGKLKRSIKAEQPIETPAGIISPISLLGYYVFPDLGTKYQRAQKFIERAQTNVLNREINDIALAAAEDVAEDLAKSLPNEVDLTIQL